MQNGRNSKIKKHTDKHNNNNNNSDDANSNNNKSNTNTYLLLMKLAGRSGAEEGVGRAGRRPPAPFFSHDINIIVSQDKLLLSHMMNYHCI